MAEQFADAVEVDSGLKQVRGEAVPQRVDAADLGDSSGVASEVVVALATGAIERPRWIRSSGKQPVRGVGMTATGSPVQPQLLQQLAVEQAVPILAALALDHPNAHAVGGRVDVAAAQVTQFAQAQAAGIGRYQEGVRLA